MEMIAALRLVSVGDEIEVLSSDKGSINDIPEWVAKCGHQMVGIEHREGYSSLVMRKAK